VGNSLGEPLLTGAAETELLFERPPTLGAVVFGVLPASEGLRDGGGHDGRVQPAGDRLEDGRVDESELLGSRTP